MSHIDPGERARMKAYRERKAGVTARRAEILRARAAERERADIARTLGDELSAALMRYLTGAAPASAENVKRALALVGYSDELKKLIVRCIETNPAMEESFLLIAELAYRDGEDAAHEDTWHAEYY